MRGIKSILWGQGISGDIPIVLVIIRKYEDINIIHDVLKAHEYWHAKGVNADLVVISKEGVRYDHPLWTGIYEIVSMGHLRNMQNVTGGIHLLRGEILNEDEINILKKAATIIYEEDKIVEANNIKSNSREKLSFVKREFIHENKSKRIEEDFFNGFGGFDEKANEYVIHLSENNYTPVPWSNVIANENFGSVLTETGGGFTWLFNSREFRITPWDNDAISDRRGEIIYIRDDETGELFNPYLLPCEKSGDYEVRYGIGYVKYLANICGFQTELTVFIPLKDNIKISSLKIKNVSNIKRKMSLVYYVEPVLQFSNNLREKYIEVYYSKNKIIFSNKYETEFADKEIFMSICDDVYSYDLDKESFFGFGKEKDPEIFCYDKLAESDKFELPIGALQVKKDFAPGEEKEIIFLLGEENVYEKYSLSENVKKELDNVKKYFKEEIMKIKINTPDKAMNLLINGFLLYQTLVCRIWAKSAFYQSGGATGFRDQLQDVIPFSYINSEITKKQILLHAEHQFKDGDVLHWWHEEGKKGTRTKFSDDLLWLPYVTCEYIMITGDESILDEKISFVSGEYLSDDEYEKYIEYIELEEKETLLTHIIIAIEHSYRLGKHGLVLMASGDWNDGMNLVGRMGEGESVWLTMFIYKILTAMAPILRKKEMNELAEKYSADAAALSASIDFAWDGEWYKRAFFDDGTPLGSIKNDECKIDSISQSWSVISGISDLEKSIKAMKSVENYLIDKEENIIKLLSPPFSGDLLNPGYIKNYPEGVRENGGQYTHAAVWVGIAYAILGNKEKANEVFEMINPINHAKTRGEVNKYKVEPYVISADIYSHYMHKGRGGWSWYTGAAGWMYRFGIEYILGFKRRKDIIVLEPNLRKEWEECEIEYQYNLTVYKIKIKNSIKGSTSRLIIDGVLNSGNSFQIIDDGGIHFIEFVVPE